MLSRIFKDPTDAALFEGFIEQLLQHCGRWPEPKSVLVMDNACFHRSDRIKQLCSDAGVRLLYLAPYAPDCIPIEEFFAELKVYIKKAWPIQRTPTKALKLSFSGALMRSAQENRVRKATFEMLA